MGIKMCIFTSTVAIVFSFIAQGRSYWRPFPSQSLRRDGPDGCAEAACVFAQTVCSAMLSFHTGGLGWVHYFDCHLTICLYDRRPWSLAIDGRETHRFITRRPPVAFKSGSAHRYRHVECSSAEGRAIDCVEVNGRVIFFCVCLLRPSCHPVFTVIWLQNLLVPLWRPSVTSRSYVLNELTVRSLSIFFIFTFPAS